MLEEEKPGPGNRFIYRFAHCELSEATGELRVRGELVPLPPRDRAVLFLLVRRAGEFVSNEEAAAAVWGDYPVSGKTVGNAIWNVRQAVGDEDHSIIKNERNRGYILVAPIEKTAADATPELQLIEGMPVPGRTDCILKEKIGAGGYGDVWLCEGRDGRSVFKFSRESAHVAAIKREVTISRLLQASLPESQHDYFVPIIEWDFEVWPSYVETPYAGNNLKAWAQAKGGLKSIPIDERLEIMATIAEAVGIAHSVGALHKDLKPENILIEESPGGRLVRLADFGAGHLLDKEKLKQLEITMRGWTMTRAADATSGTLLWMAPELFEGATPTLQSDLYSLGVLLYQMVVGDLGRVLAPDWSPDISDELLREDIDIATRRNPAQRLGDAKELARRLRMLVNRRTDRDQLRDQLKRTEEAEEALKKARARRPFVWATAITLLLGLCTSSYFYYEQVQKTRAAQALSDFVADDFLNAALPISGGTATITLKDAMIRAIPLARKRFEKEPDLETKILAVFANTTSDLGAYKENAEITQRLVELDSKLHGPNSDYVLIDRLIIAYDLLQQGSVSEANQRMDALGALIRNQGTAGKAYPMWLQIESIFAFEQSDFEKAVTQARETAEFYKSKIGKPDFEPDQLDAANLSLVQALVYSGRSEEVLRLAGEVLPDVTRRDGIASNSALTLQQFIASAHRDLRQFDDAETELNSICPAMEKELGSTQKDSLECRYQQALLFEAMQRWPDAEAAFRHVHDGYIELSNGRKIMTPCIFAAADLAFSMAKNGHADDALALARGAARDATQSTSADPWLVPHTYYVLASIAIDAGKLDEAQQAYARFSAEIRNPATNDSNWHGRDQLLQAKLLYAENHHDAAHNMLKEALSSLQEKATQTLVEVNDAKSLQERFSAP